MLLAHLMRAAASRTFWTAGSNRPMSIAIMAITTNNSINVNARRVRLVMDRSGMVGGRVVWAGGEGGARTRWHGGLKIRSVHEGTGMVARRSLEIAKLRRRSFCVWIGLRRRREGHVQF